MNPVLKSRTGGKMKRYNVAVVGATTHDPRAGLEVRGHGTGLGKEGRDVAHGSLHAGMPSRAVRAPRVFDFDGGASSSASWSEMYSCPDERAVSIVRL